MFFNNQMQERFNPGTDLTAVATDQVVGKTLVTYSKGLTSGLISVATAAPGKAVAGVAKYDANTGEHVGVARGSGRIVTITAATGLKAGDPVTVGDTGKATTATDNSHIVGWCVDDADADTDALISLAH